MTLRACRYVGLPDSFSGERVKTILQTWPENKAACFDLCTRLLSRWRPSPFESLWVTFGFCVCPDEFSEGGEAALAQLYQQLIQRASFEELWMAYDKSALLDLINCKGLTSSLLHFPHLTDVLQGSPNGFKSVWYLKQFVISEEGETLSPRLEISVAIDYGFVNCREEIQKQELKGLYKQFFLEASGDPIKLHEACIRGRLFDYVSKLVMLKKDERKMFKSLLKNPYPLPDL
ncbi:hypothetical protein AcW1_004886 [Taiwanofungus camphoratus]|nr:hypothetical protein AcW2_006104 [Antrodia cinnamomea]KAI0940065.1 hypothetical protein AcV5_001272 [Antrodia cinnamomea]KAI0941386.1 hypothetical protein AcV7_002977 [Antrodia cinnamomea]KAI0960349.1 hypothetical protein AcW1_004886 [Antrodia cinnamomea]